MRRALLPALLATLVIVLALAARVPSRARPAGADSPTSPAREAGGSASPVPVNGGRARSGPATSLVTRPATRPAVSGGRAGSDDAGTEGHDPSPEDPEGAGAVGEGEVEREAGSGAWLDLDGDLGPEDRAWLTDLAAQHGTERPDEPWVVRWALVEAGEPLVDPEQVATVAARALADERGWSLGGAIRFERVATAEEADLRLVVAAADEVPGYAEDCRSERTGDPDASCTVGDDVIINDARWRDGALGDPIPLEQFRVHEINHEVGHWLGQGHFSCVDGPAPLNQQQFRSLQGCTANEWPLPFERAMVAARFGLWPGVGTFEVYDAWGPERETAVEEPSTAVTSG
ncbi:MAG: DUF3152 domain-containing protein [Acidimicrobiales bacterium]|nr:DUF3152 domain-containing protein [Acidimicrobiales bacterium]